MKDKTLVNKLWWLNKILNKQFKGKEYKDIYDIDLDTDITKELDEIVAHIKLNY